VALDGLVDAVRASPRPAGRHLHHRHALRGRVREGCRPHAGEDLRERPPRSLTANGPSRNRTASRDSRAAVSSSGSKPPSRAASER
jgi:hypothetical protein